MNIIIIEDERLTAEDLKDIITDNNPDCQVIKILSSVKEAVDYLQANPQPDLIFSDIQLGDGLSFEIYKKVKINVPIVFCTAYDEYALTAFETNGIHYILKPFDEGKIAEAIEKFKTLKNSFHSEEDHSLTKVLDLLQNKQNENSGSILVYQQDKVIPVKLKNIALFYIKNEVTHLLTFDQKVYYVNKSLDEVQQTCGYDFYRANRQFILNREAIKEVSQTLSRKISVSLKFDFDEDILVSKEKMTDFLTWLKA
ncbi:MAG: DNA-binding response regulator [Bacteroidetes bacterium 43-16]|nr:MAG: DNA-binding response regulator [Bacteroidetes bacterium 43-16]